MPTIAPDKNIQFLTGSGEMATLTREKDWSKTSLGPIESWPQSLRTSLSIVLNSKFPMLLLWGKELTCFYNDAFRPSLGNEGKHPSMLGMRSEQAWAEIWDIIKPWIDKVLETGEAVIFEDQLVPFYRNGSIETIYWTFCYSPVCDESDKRAGVFVSCNETTDKVVTMKKLAESNSQLEFAINAAELGTWDYNPLTNQFSSNNRLKEWFGLPANEEIELSDAINAILESDRQRVTAAIQKALDFSSGGYYDIEYTIVHPGTKKQTLVQAKGRAWFNNEKVAYRFNGTLEDITEQAAATKEIKESEQRFAAAVQAVKGIVWTNNDKGEMTGEQPGWAELTGQTYEEYRGYGWANAVHPDDRQPTIDAWNEALKEARVFNFEHRVKVKDGNWRAFSIKAIPLKNDDGSVREWVGVHTDIEKQKTFAAELEKQVVDRTKELILLNESLKKSEARYHLMVEEVQDYAILYLNRDGIVENWNAGAEKIKGYKASEIIGKSFSSFYTEEDRKDQLPRKLLARAAETGRAVQEGWRVRKNGSLFWASVVITAVHNEKNEVVGFSKVTHDLTEKKAADDKLKENALQLEQKNTTLEKMNKELQSFAYISSHDLQEPLRKIQTFASLLLEKESMNLSENGKDLFKRMQASALRMQTLIDDLLAYSRTNTSERKYEKTNLNEIVDEVKTDLQEELQQKHATIETNDLGSLNIIPFQFRQLLVNLISNSLKFSVPERRSMIKIESETAMGSTFKNDRLSDNTKYCHISISDNGIGFEQEYNHRIFELFQRLHGKGEYRGTGIGLSIVKKIVENHDGIIAASGEPDKGATFDIYLPVNR